ncbi:MAG: lysylphosphatidylglycerol synthase transmembrane domain-containing protein [Myxococcota bacterium]|nr:lysylphosphatidylglycerol synthase transmembrane domain-containing protein [Myxococcota bacterium]
MGLLLVIGGAVASRLGSAGDLEIRERLSAPWLAMAVLAYLAGNFLAGPRFLVLLTHRPRRPLGGATVGSLLLAVSVLNLSFPGPAGELAAVIVLQRRYGIPAGAGLATALSSRFVGLFTSALIVGATLPFLSLTEGMAPLLVTVALVLGSAGLAIALLALRPTWIAAVSDATAGAVSRRWSGRIGRSMGQLHELMVQFADHMSQMTRIPPHRWLLAVAWSLALQAVLFGCTMSTAWAVGTHPEHLGAFFTQNLSALASLAMVVLPGGFGAFDLTFAGSLAASADLDAAQAGLVLVNMRLVHVLGLACCGLLFLSWARQLLAEEVLQTVHQGHISDDDGTASALEDTGKEPILGPNS